MLTEPETTFIERHKIDVKNIHSALDADTKRAGGIRAKSLGCRYMVCKPCPQGHRIHNYHGNCVQCSPAGIKHAARAGEGGYIYVLRSAELGLTKIGMTADIKARMRSITTEGYGGAKDWAVVFSCQSARAGLVEKAAQKRFRDMNVRHEYIKQGALQVGREMFDVAPDVAIDVVKKLLDANQ